MVFIPFELPQPFSFENQLQPLKGYGPYSFPSGKIRTLPFFFLNSLKEKHKAPKGKGLEGNNIINNKEFIDNHAFV
ncbi:unnamed protein product [Camellia sinensis]